MLVDSQVPADSWRAAISCFDSHLMHAVLVEMLRQVTRQANVCLQTQGPTVQMLVAAGDVSMTQSMYIVCCHTC
jgi:hypothetical protein